MAPHLVAGLGVARTYQNIRLFQNMTVLNNVMVGRHVRMHGQWYQAIAGLAGIRQEEAATKRRAFELMELVGIPRASATELSRNLPYGDQRRLEIARALASDPKLLLLDEPTAGMGVEDVDRTIALVKRVAQGRTVVLVDHNMHVVGSLADRVTVLQAGAVLAEGPYDEVRTDERVITAYLGQESGGHHG
jgi:branched-chain amino acid transport system ATP-binding protein